MAFLRVLSSFFVSRSVFFRRRTDFFLRLRACRESLSEVSEDEEDVEDGEAEADPALGSSLLRALRIDFEMT